MYHVCCTFTSCSNNFYRALDANPHPAHRAPTASPTALANRGRSRRFGRAHLDSYAAIDHVSSWGEKPFLGKLRLCHSLGSGAVVPNLNHVRVEITGGYVRISKLALAPRTSCAAGYEKDSSEKRSNFTIACGELGATVNERIEAAGSGARRSAAHELRGPCVPSSALPKQCEPSVAISLQGVLGGG